MDATNLIKPQSLEKKLTSYKFLNTSLIIGFIYLIIVFIVYFFNFKPLKTTESESKNKSQNAESQDAESQDAESWFNKTSKATKTWFVTTFSLVIISVIGLFYWFGGIFNQSAYFIKDLFNFNLNPTISLIITILSIIGFFMMSYFGGTFSKASGTAAIIGFIVFLLFFSISGFIYIKRRNEDDNILKGLPRSLQDAFNLRTKYTFILILFILLTMLLYLFNPLGIMTNYGGPVIFFTLFVGIICAILITVYQKFLANPVSASRVNEIPSGLDLIGKGLYILLSLGISGGLIYSALKFIGVFNQDASKPESWGHVIFNLLLFSSMLGILYKLANAGGFLDKNPLYRLIVNTLLYIPCLLVSVTNYIVQLYRIITGATFTPTKSFEIKMLIISLILLGGYFTWVFLLKQTLNTRYLKQGGEQFVNQPISTDVLTNIASYQTLSGSEKFDYRYAMSFWFYIDSFPPSTNASYMKVVPILSYGKNPEIKYSSETNTMYITVKQDDGSKDNVKQESSEMNKQWKKYKDKNRNKDVLDNSDKDDKSKSVKDKITDAIEKVKTMSFGNDTDSDGNRIIYKHPDVLLQKWNHVVLNYNGGTLDVFYNGKLVKSAIEVVPYMTRDFLTIGSENGIKGNVSNLMYFKMPLDILTIHTLYTSLKDKNPPSISENQETIIPIQN